MTAQNNATLDSASPVPLYQQLFLLLRNQIHAGALRPGQKVMGEAELCDTFDVSRITAKRALNELADSGLVVRQRGRGTLVSDRLPPQPMSSSIDGLLETVGQMGRHTSVRVLFSDMVIASQEAAAKLRLGGGDRALLTQRVRYLADQPMSYLEVWVPEDIGAMILGQKPSQTPVLIQLEQAGVAVASATQTISATLADGTSASALGVPMGAPLIDSRRVVFDAGGRPVEFIRVLYRPELYHYEISMQRVEGDNGRSWIPGSAPQV
ncbi:GntR family transcriptional regulator [Pseudooceanicola sediminis]|uniref:GntR family transcriptional regulator n=1 Tax=Pseudooceanicola sediminis TaxID=2211117 RepID=UPI001313DA3C|nr:GntR family transcriptional regulator [Pseudooceanicola sediminis]